MLQPHTGIVKSQNKAFFVQQLTKGNNPWYAYDSGSDILLFVYVLSLFHPLLQLKPIDLKNNSFEENVRYFYSEDVRFRNIINK